MMLYIDLEVYYRIEFALMQHHKYSRADIGDMFPYERDLVYVMIINYLKELEEKNKNK